MTSSHWFNDYFYIGVGDDYTLQLFPITERIKENVSSGENNDSPTDEVSMNLSLSLSGWQRVKINVRYSKKKFPILVALESSVRSFRSLIVRHCDIPAQQQLLIYKGRILKDDQTLESYGN